MQIVLLNVHNKLRLFVVRVTRQSCLKRNACHRLLRTAQWQRQEPLKRTVPHSLPPITLDTHIEPTLSQTRTIRIKASAPRERAALRRGAKHIVQRRAVAADEEDVEPSEYREGD